MTVVDDLELSQNRRRVRRYSISVPVDVIALRSGVPASIPGRTVNVSEGGMAMMLAGELSAGESVGVEFRLPLAREPIQAKAVVKHCSLMKCGLQFLAMPEEQETALRTWTEVADRTAILVSSKPLPVEPKTVVTAAEVKPGERKLARQTHGLRWVLMSASVVAVVLAVLAWWSWNSGWRELEDGKPSNASALPVDVSSSVMGQRIVHRVDPIYPSEALRAKVQGQVMLETIIGEDGTVRDVYAVSGPDLLRAAAVDAVKWWRFEPYEVDGHAAQVHTLIEVDFRLNR